ncbi:MAG: hypothetical protein RLZZ611_173 [Cyanobacteriota bacterium]
MTTTSHMQMPQRFGLPENAVRAIQKVLVAHPEVEQAIVVRVPRPRPPAPRLRAAVAGAHLGGPGCQWWGCSSGWGGCSCRQTEVPAADGLSRCCFWQKLSKMRWLISGFNGKSAASAALVPLNRPPGAAADALILPAWVAVVSQAAG